VVKKGKKAAAARVVKVRAETEEIINKTALQTVKKENGLLQIYIWRALYLSFFNLYEY
jgi:hypothetical protein